VRNEEFQIYEWQRATVSGVFHKRATASGTFVCYKYHTPFAQFSQTQFSQTQIQQTSNFFKMLPNLNYYPDEEKIILQNNRAAVIF
jgi:hypothetical protein